MSKVETSRTVQIAVRLRKDQLEALDKAVSLGIFENRTEAIRDAVDLLLLLLATSTLSLNKVYLQEVKKRQNLTPRDLYQLWFKKSEESEDSHLHDPFLLYFLLYQDSMAMKIATPLILRKGKYEELLEALLTVVKRGFQDILGEASEFSSSIEEEEGEKTGVRPMSKPPSEDSDSER